MGMQPLEHLEMASFCCPSADRSVILIPTEGSATGIEPLKDFQVATFGGSITVLQSSLSPRVPVGMSPLEQVQPALLCKHQYASAPRGSVDVGAEEDASEQVADEGKNRLHAWVGGCENEAC